MLKQQYAFYQDKLKSEERIRGIYHDLKNYILIMEGQKEIPKTNQMAKELLLLIKDYEDYVHTGNDFLDIIIKNKAEKAREKCIDFSVAVRMMVVNEWSSTYHFTLMPLVICTPVLVILAALIPYICFKNLEKQSVIERLREAD